MIQTHGHCNESQKCWSQHCRPMLPILCLNQTKTWLIEQTTSFVCIQDPIIWQLNVFISFFLNLCKWQAENMTRAGLQSTPKHTLHKTWLDYYTWIRLMVVQYSKVKLFPKYILKPYFNVIAFITMSQTLLAMMKVKHAVSRNP